MSTIQNYYEMSNNKKKISRERATTPPRKRRKLNKTESNETLTVGQILFAMTTVLVALKVYEYLYFVN